MILICIEIIDLINYGFNWFDNWFPWDFFWSLIDLVIDLVIDFGSWLSAATFLAQTWGLPLLKGQSKALAHSCPCQKSSVSFFLSVALPKGQSILVERMAGKGGARHQPKPMVDEMLLVTAFKNSNDIIKTMGRYEKISSSQSPDPKGIMECYELLSDLVKLSPSAEIHTSSLRGALLKVLQEDPSLNSTQFNGGVWANMKGRCITVCLNHLRQIKGWQDLGLAAAKLTSAEFVLLKKLLNAVDGKEKEEKPKRQLKMEVSTDSQGYPLMLKTPPGKESPLPIADGPLPKGKNPCQKDLQRRRAHQSLGGGLVTGHPLLVKSKRCPSLKKICSRPWGLTRCLKKKRGKGQPKRTPLKSPKQVWKNLLQGSLVKRQPAVLGTGSHGTSLPSQRPASLSQGLTFWVLQTPKTKEASWL